MIMSTCLLSDVFRTEGCLAGLDIYRCGCHGLHVDTGRWVDTKRTGCVRFATHLRTWRMSSISCLVAQFTVMSDESMPSLFQQAFSKFSDTNSEPNACGGFLREYFSRRKSFVST